MRYIVNFSFISCEYKYSWYIYYIIIKYKIISDFESLRFDAFEKSVDIIK